MSPILPPKKDVALALLEKASVFVHLDPRPEDVMVPAWLKKQAQLVLQVGLNMAVKIPDLEVGDESVSCTLSFSRRPCFCSVPWHAVYALVGEDGRGMVWPEDIPPEVATQTQSAAAAAQRGGLRAVSDRTEAKERDASAAVSPSRAAQPAGSVRPPKSFPSQVPPARAQRRSERAGLQALEGDKNKKREPAAAPVSEAPGESERRPSERPYLRLIK